MLEMYFWTFALFFVTQLDMLKADQPCDKFELLTCGDSQLGHKWMFCRPKAAGSMRIKSIHLDVRFHNRYCRRDETAENFGMTKGRETMWVVNYCFGTFFVCLDTAPISPTEDTGGIVHGNAYASVDWEEYTSQPTTVGDIETFRDGGKELKDKTTVGFDAVEKTKTTQTNLNLIKPSGPFVVDQNSQKSEDSTKKEMQVSNNDSTSKELYKMDPELKIWIMASIITGSLILIALIIMIACLTMKCESLNRSVSEDPDQYFRQEKHSTSTLMAPDFDSDQSIYDCINDVTLDMQINNEQPITCDKNEESSYHTYRVLNVVKQSSESDYLCPGVEKEDPSVNIYSRIDQDNNYDHIVSKMRPPASDSTMYCKLYTDFTQCPEDIKERAIYKAVKERLEQTEEARKQTIE